MPDRMVAVRLQSMRMRAILEDAGPLKVHVGVDDTVRRTALQI